MRLHPGGIEMILALVAPCSKLRWWSFLFQMMHRVVGMLRYRPLRPVSTKRMSRHVKMIIAQSETSGRCKSSARVWIVLEGNSLIVIGNRIHLTCQLKSNVSAQEHHDMRLSMNRGPAQIHF